MPASLLTQTVPPDGLNFGHLFTDKANQPLLNQLLLTVQRPLDPKATDYDFGFKVQAMYGTDARFTAQITPVEAWGVVHTPCLFSGGIDFKAGQWVTLEGTETIDPTTNYFYSHSYIFDFGIPSWIPASWRSRMSIQWWTFMRGSSLA